MGLQDGAKGQGVRYSVGKPTLPRVLSGQGRSPSGPGEGGQNSTQVPRDNPLGETQMVLYGKSRHRSITQAAFHATLAQVQAKMQLLSIRDSVPQVHSHMDQPYRRANKRMFQEGTMRTPCFAAEAPQFAMHDSSPWRGTYYMQNG